MAEYAFQRVIIYGNALYACWPMIVGNKRTWNPRYGDNSSHWKVLLGQYVTVDLIADAQFSEYEAVTPWINVQAGNDASSNTILTVAHNGRTALLEATGTTLDSHLYYKGPVRTSSTGEVEVLEELSERIDPIAGAKPVQISVTAKKGNEGAAATENGTGAAQITAT